MFRVTNEVSNIYFVRAGTNMIVNLPHNLIEIQEVGERRYGTK